MRRVGVISQEAQLAALLLDLPIVVVVGQAQPVAGRQLADVIQVRGGLRQLFSRLALFQRAAEAEVGRAGRCSKRHCLLQTGQRIPHRLRIPDLAAHMDARDRQAVIRQQLAERRGLT